MTEQVKKFLPKNCEIYNVYIKDEWLVAIYMYKGKLNRSKFKTYGRGLR